MFFLCLVNLIYWERYSFWDHEQCHSPHIMWRSNTLSNTYTVPIIRGCAIIIANWSVTINGDSEFFGDRKASALTISHTSVGTTVRLSHPFNRENTACCIGRISSAIVRGWRQCSPSVYAIIKSPCYTSGWLISSTVECESSKFIGTAIPSDLYIKWTCMCAPEGLIVYT